MGSRMTQELVSQALWNAVKWKRPPMGLILHSDRGRQYCEHNYRRLIEQFGLKASMSRKGNCYDNAPMESFWGSLKNELIHHQRYKSRESAISSIREYIEIFYNRQRRHSRLGNVAPAVFAQNFNKNCKCVWNRCVYYCQDRSDLLFTAAQAAQKSASTAAISPFKFTAAQAAQKD